MERIKRFADRGSGFWATVKFISEGMGYSDRKTRNLRRYGYQETIEFLNSNNLFSEEQDQLIRDVIDYLNERARMLEVHVKPNLMDRTKARRVFEELVKKYSPKCKLPMNKQTGDKRHYAFLTCIVNILTEATLRKCEVDVNPRGMTSSHTLKGGVSIRQTQHYGVLLGSQYSGSLS